MTTTTCLESAPRTLLCDTSCEPLAVQAARAACALERSIQRLVQASDQNLGHLEVQTARDVQELLAKTIERGAQAKAGRHAADLSGVRDKPLSRLSAEHPRTF